MSLADYFVLAVIALAAVGAILYGRRHSCGCSGNCASCGQRCTPKKSDLSGDGAKEKGKVTGDGET